MQITEELQTISFHKPESVPDFYFRFVSKTIHTETMLFPSLMQNLQEAVDHDSSNISTIN